MATFLSKLSFNNVGLNVRDNSYSIRNRYPRAVYRIMQCRVTDKPLYYPWTLIPTISLVVALGFIVRNADLGASGSERGVKASTLEKCGCKLEPCAPRSCSCWWFIFANSRLVSSNNHPISWISSEESHEWVSVDFALFIYPQGAGTPALKDMTSPALGGRWACLRPLPALGRRCCYYLPCLACIHAHRSPSAGDVTLLWITSGQELVSCFLENQNGGRWSTKYMS